MFRTSKLISAGVLSLLVTTAVHAQTAEQPSFNEQELISAITASSDDPSAAPEVSQEDLNTLMSQLVSGKKLGSAENDDFLKQAITGKIIELMTMSTTPVDVKKTVTVRDLDELNKNAVRAKTQLELEKVKSQQVQTQINNLLSIYKAIETINPDSLGSNGSKKSTSSYSTRGQTQTSRSNEEVAPPSPEMIRENHRKLEMASLPRVINITGVQNNYMATVQLTDGNTIQVSYDDMIDANLSVSNMDPNAITLKSATTGEEYRVSPKGVSASSGSIATPTVAPQLPLAQMSSDLRPDGTSPKQPQNAVSLDGLPFSVF